MSSSEGRRSLREAKAAYEGARDKASASLSSTRGFKLEEARIQVSRPQEIGSPEKQKTALTASAP